MVSLSPHPMRGEGMFDETFLISDHHAPSRDHDELFVGHGEFAPVRRADDEGAKSIRDFLADLFPDSLTPCSCMSKNLERTPRQGPTLVARSVKDARREI
ncbi:MAG: hypothetical protein DME26_16525 [Verrucomicrobia bacterium]|nr:MAG: hypothetical protein DME26_16525 [Verrucomicrobiota bacterium]